MAMQNSRYCIILLQGRTLHKERFGTLSRGLVSKIQRKLDQVVKSSKERTEIEIWLDSPGGDAHATYKLMLDLRQRCQRVEVIIPDFAKSAATLLTLGTDRIYMAAGAELGPLDVQISHPDREDQVISGLDVAGSLDYLSKFAMNLVLTGGAAVMEATELPRSEVLRAMQSFTARFLQPSVAKLDPLLTRRAVYQLKVAERYAIAMLAGRNVPPANALKPDAAKQLVTHFVNMYPVHEFIISREEARAFGLPVEHAEAHERWPLVKLLHSRFADTGTPVIEVASLADVAGLVASILRPGTAATATPKNEPAGRKERSKNGKAKHPSRAPGRNGSAGTPRADGSSKRLLINGRGGG